MVKKIKTIFFFFSFIVFIFLITNHYFSEENIIYMNKSRSTYSLIPGDELPMLKNDTKNIIVYKNDIEEFKRKNPKRIWEKLISND